MSLSAPEFKFQISQLSDPVEARSVAVSDCMDKLT